jgi:hypothetical protein
VTSLEAASENPTQARKCRRYDEIAGHKLLTRGLDILGMDLAAMRMLRQRSSQAGFGMAN